MQHRLSLIVLPSQEDMSVALLETVSGIDFHAIGHLFGLSAEVLWLLLTTSETFMTLPFFSEKKIK